MRSVKKKLGSRAGASITFALLLFLVCAVVSSVVIVAATAAAGRLSQLPRMEQRYYAVTSAAGLLRDTIDARVVTVEYDKAEKTPEATKVVRLNPTGDPAVEYSKDDEGAEKPAILAEASEKVIAARKGLNGDIERTYNLTVFQAGGAAVSDARLECAVTEKLENGLLSFQISSAPESDADRDIYTLTITFSSNARQSASDAGVNTETTTVEWKFLSMKKERNAAALGG